MESTLDGETLCHDCVHSTANPCTLFHSSFSSPTATFSVEASQTRDRRSCFSTLVQPLLCESPTCQTDPVETNQPQPCSTTHALQLPKCHSSLQSLSTKLPIILFSPRSRLFYKQRRMGRCPYCACYASYVLCVHSPRELFPSHNSVGPGSRIGRSIRTDSVARR